MIDWREVKLTKTDYRFLIKFCNEQRVSDGVGMRNLFEMLLRKYKAEVLK